MNKLSKWALPLVAACAGLALVANAQTDSGGKLQPVDGAPQLDEVVPLQAVFDAAHWKAELTHADFAARRNAMHELADQARSNPDAQAALEAWAAEGDACLSWTAYLTLEELRSKPQTTRQDPFHDWFKGGPSFLRPFGADPFGQGIFDRDPFAVQDLMRELQDSLDRLPQGTRQHGQELSIESGPDGVKVERRSTVDGDETFETFEAENMEQLLELHPELKAELKLQPLSSGPDEMRSLLDRLRIELDVPQSVMTPGEVRTDMLGVMMREADAWRGRVDGLEPGTGLYVENVLPGTIAEAVGLRAGDIVAKLNGKPLRTAADVRAVLDARGESESLELEWFDRNGALQRREWKP